MARSRRPRSVAAIEGLEHGDDMLGEERFLLPGRAAMGVADAGENGRDMPVVAIERLAALRELPGQGGEAALDGGHRVRLSAVAAPDAHAVI
jgi:hypothetical protein